MGEMNEKSALLPKDQRQPLQSFVLGPILFANAVSYILFLYVITDYTQSSVKKDVLGNRSDDIFNNFSECNSNKSGEIYQLHLKIQQDTSTWLIYFNLAGNVPAIFANPLIGSYSDTFGRKVFLYFSLIGTTCKVAVIACVMYFELDHWIIIFGFFASGNTGQLPIFAYVADITSAGKQRSIGIMITEGVGGIAGAISSFASGYYINYVGYFYSMLTCVGCNTLCLLLLCCLPESLPKNRRSKRKSIPKTMRNAFQFYFGSKHAKNRWKYDLYIICFICISLGAKGRPAIEALYQLGPPFCWSPDQIGIFGSIRIAGSYVIGFLFAKVLQWCISDESIAILGTFSAVASLVVEAFATTDLILYMVPVINVMSIATFPMVRALMSVMTPIDSQGALFAGLQMFNIMCTLGSSVMNNAIYSATLSIMNGLVFLVLAGFYALAFIILAALSFVQNESGRKQTQTIEKEVN